MQVTHYTESAEGVIIQFDRGQPPVHAKLLIGADGYFSHVRQQCLADGPPQFVVSPINTPLSVFEFGFCQVSVTDTLQLKCAQAQDTAVGLLCSALLCCAAQRSTAQHSAAQRSTAQRSTAQHSAAQRSTAQHSAAQRSTAQHSAAQRSTAQHSAAQHSHCSIKQTA